MENYSIIKFIFLRNVNAILNGIEHTDNVEIKNRKIEIDKHKIKITNDKFIINVGIDTGYKCDIFCKKQDCVYIIGISSILLMVVGYFDYIMTKENEKRGDKNEL